MQVCAPPVCGSGCKLGRRDQPSCTLSFAEFHRDDIVHATYLRTNAPLYKFPAVGQNHLYKCQELRSCCSVICRVGRNSEPKPCSSPRLQYAHLCHNLPGHDDDLDRVERDKPSQVLERPSPSYPDLAGHDVYDDGSGNGQGRHRQNGCEHNAACAVGALATREAQLYCVAAATNGAVCSKRRRREEWKHSE